MKKRDRGADPTGRSKRDAKHVRHYEYMLTCPAYRSLSLAGRCLLTELYRLFNGENNGELYLSVRAAAALLSINPKTALKAFHELERRGFIRPRQRGAFSLKSKHATSWVLTEFEHAGQVATKEFMRWRPGANDPAEIQNSVPLRGTVGTPTRNTVPLRGTEKPPVGTPTRNRDDENDSSIGTPTRNTDSLPWGDASDSEVRDRAVGDDQRGEPPHQIDLEDATAAAPVESSTAPLQKPNLDDFKIGRGFTVIRGGQPPETKCMPTNGKRSP